LEEFGMGGFARDKKGKEGGANYAQRGCNSVMKKLEGIKGAKFYNLDFLDLTDHIPEGSLIYCDPPYKNTSPYNKQLLGEFPYEIFIEWVKIMSEYNIVLVSEYKHNVYKDAKIVLEIPQRKSMRDKNGNHIETVEVLFTYNNLEQ
jgi:DNA adenine methylase